MAEEESSHQEDNSDSNMLGVLDPTVHATTSAIPQNDTPNFSILSIQRNQEEAGSSRPTRESVLQRLSEALLRHSLAKVIRRPNIFQASRSLFPVFVSDPYIISVYSLD